jgi:hypothetical protein
LRELVAQLVTAAFLSHKGVDLFALAADKYSQFVVVNLRSLGQAILNC